MDGILPWHSTVMPIFPIFRFLCSFWGDLIDNRETELDAFAPVLWFEFICLFVFKQKSGHPAFRMSAGLTKRDTMKVRDWVCVSETQGRSGPEIGVWETLACGGSRTSPERRGCLEPQFQSLIGHCPTGSGLAGPWESPRAHNLFFF